MTNRKKVKTKEKKKEHSPGVLKRMQNLVQYSNKEIAKKRGPSKIPQDVSEIVVEPDVVDIEDMTIQVPEMRELAVNRIPITVAAVLNKTELKLYVKEVAEWASSHPDWNKKEDIDDINNIAMEKVIQYRLLINKKRHPNTDIEKDYASSMYRMQVSRQNLAARRTDRINKKNSGGGQTNIAIIAGSLDDDKIKIIKKRNENDTIEEDSMFPVVKE